MSIDARGDFPLARSVLESLLYPDCLHGRLLLPRLFVGEMGLAL